MADLAVELCGAHLSNPLVLASGPLSWNATGIRAAFSAGAAAVVTKTIRAEATRNPVPHIAALGGGNLLNAEGWSDLAASQWIEYELPALAGREGVLIASTGHTAREVRELAGPLAATGIDMLELVSYRAEDVVPMVTGAKAAVSIPVLVKVSANWPDMVEVVGRALDAGADGVTAIDSIGPALSIDVERVRPELGQWAWLSGPAIRPMALAAVASICAAYDVPLVGTGGVGRAEDVVEMVMAGASAVGVHTAPLLRGLGWFARTLGQLNGWLASHGYHSLAELQGAALPDLREAASYGRLNFTFDCGMCTYCRRCVTVCAYGARDLRDDGDMLLEVESCRSCGLCVSVCPTGALSTEK